MRKTWFILLFVFALFSCSHKESVLEIISNTQYEESGHHSSWAGKEWTVFSWKGDKVFAAGTLISPFAYDSVFWIIKEEFGEPNYSRKDFVRNPGLALSDTIKFDLARWENLEDIYYWCNDSYVICWSFFDMDSTIMKGYSYLTIDQLKVKQPETHVSDIFLNAQYGDTHAISDWAGRHWEIFGNAASPDFEALTLRISPYTFDSIRALICQEYGAPTYNHHTLPSELVPQADTGTFWMAWKEHNQFYYWCKDTVNIGWGLFGMDSTSMGYAWLYIERLKVGPYEAYMDSLFSTSDEYHNQWGNFDYFKSARQKKFVNYIYYADSYDTYFGLLNEYFPACLSDKSTEYDKYLASLVQIEQVLDFPGDQAGTWGMYFYQDYGKRYIDWCIQKFTDLSRNSGFYSAEVDSAWNEYCRAMFTVVDSVVMDRPSCLGTISYMEKYGFIGNHKEAKKNALLDELFDKERDEHHATISDDMIAKAYKDLKSHLREPEYKEYQEDLWECYVPLATRKAAVDEDERAWNKFIKARNEKAKTLGWRQRKAYNNATNNLKRNKLWLLKNEYHYYAMCEASFQTLLLEPNCTDEELQAYDFQKAYKAVYGDHVMFY